jgi:hypothetical protein
MISDQEFLEIIHGLHEKTAEQNLKWQAKQLTPFKPVGQHVVPTSGVRDAYWVQLPHAAIELQYDSPSAEPDFIVFRLSRQVNGESLAMRKVYEGDFGWEPLSDLYALIKRRALGWDDVFKSLREFLGKPNLPAAPSPQGH